MSQRQRGQEITARIAIDGVVQEGSFFKITEWTTTQRADIPEEPFLGEPQDDLDIQLHGFTFSFTAQVQDQFVLNFMTLYTDREENAQAHPDITLTLFHTYREAGAVNQVEVFQDVFLRVTEYTYSGRKDYVMATFEGKNRVRSQLAA